MFLRFVIFIILLLSFQHSYSQAEVYAREIITELCSEQFHGRGYGFGGDKLAADYIVKELKKNKLKAYKKTYLQPFNISVNTLPDNVYFKLGTVELEPGYDFVVGSSTNTISGNYQIVKLTPSIIRDSIKFRQFVRRNFSGKALLIDTLGLNRANFKSRYDLIVNQNVLNARVVINISEKNLSFIPSPVKKSFTHITVLRNSLPGFYQKITLDITSKFIENYQTNNVVGYLKGQSDSCIVLTAHYDHIGHMGWDTYFPGANDNASGVAMLFHISRELSNLKKLKYSVAFIFFSGEELGLLGSKYFTENPVFPLSKIKFLINLDMVGTGEDGIKVVNGSVFKSEFDKLHSINTEKSYLKDVKSRGAAANSDHYFFYKKGIKSFFIYTLGKYDEYHNIHDKAEKVPLNEFNDLSKLIIDFINSL